MRHIFKRNKTYYIRLCIANKLQIHFEHKRLYVRSLGVQNKNDATIISRFLISQFNYIKKSIMLLNIQQIEQYINDFKTLNYQDILNRNNHISLKQIDEDINELNTTTIGSNSTIIKNELHDFMQMMDNKYQMSSLIDMDTQDIQKFVDSIKKIKLNALVELKDKINTTITITNKNIIENIKDADNGITIIDAAKEFHFSRIGDSGYKIIFRVL
jgi:hypothetical protein